MLFGREQELAVLDQVWQDRHTHIITLVAMGGTGKTALVNEWLNRLERENYRGAVRVYGWSFYSQGVREDSQASADEFLALDRPVESKERAEKFFEWRLTSDSHLTIGLDHLTLGRACQRLGELDSAATHLAQAVDFLRQYGSQQYLPCGLLARATFYREQGQFTSARRDLDEVLEIAERCGMRLHLTDYHLESRRRPGRQPDIITI